jgi:predicted O-methyltransferase YrrM
MTKEWLHDYYGSQSGGQERQAKEWLETYGTNVTPGQCNEWKIWKHIIEYQPNTPDIVPQCLGRIDTQFDSELQAHRFVNMLRVPLSASYEQGLDIAKPKKILELGIGGDSAISTSVYLAYVEKVNGSLFSVDLNPLGMTLKRYDKYRGILWNFKLDDSVRFLKNKVALNERYDMIFIDTSHTYEQTMNELAEASKITDYMLMDDATFEGNATDAIQGGVKKAISDWFANNRGWTLKEFWQGATVLISKAKPIEVTSSSYEVKDNDPFSFTKKKNINKGKKYNA